MRYKTIAFSGTSLTSGIGAFEWPGEVRNILQRGAAYEVRTYSVGWPGRTSAMGLADIGAVTRLRPDVAVIEYAMNDAYTPSNVSVATFASNLNAMIDAIEAGSPMTDIFLMTMNPAISPGAANVPNLPTYYQKLRDVAAARSVGLIDNTPLWGSPSSGDIPDGVHPVRSAIMAVLVPNVVSVLSDGLAP